MPFQQGLGTGQTTERCRERVEQELEKELGKASRVASDRERIKRARHEEKGRDTRVEYLSNGRMVRSLKELARQVLVMVLVTNRKLRVDPLQCLNHNHPQLNRVSVMASTPENKAMMQT